MYDTMLYLKLLTTPPSQIWTTHNTHAHIHICILKSTETLFWEIYQYYWAFHWSVSIATIQFWSFIGSTNKKCWNSWLSLPALPSTLIHGDTDYLFIFLAQLTKDFQAKDHVTIIPSFVKKWLFLIDMEKTFEEVSFSLLIQTCCWANQSYMLYKFIMCFNIHELFVFHKPNFDLLSNFSINDQIVRWDCLTFSCKQGKRYQPYRWNIGQNFWYWWEPVRNRAWAGHTYWFLAYRGIFRFVPVRFVIFHPEPVETCRYLPVRCGI